MRARRSGLEILHRDVQVHDSQLLVHFFRGPIGKVVGEGRRNDLTSLHFLMHFLIRRLVYVYLMSYLNLIIGGDASGQDDRRRGRCEAG